MTWSFDAMVDPNVLSYPVPIIMRERGAVVRRGGASLWTSGEARSVLGRQVRRSRAFIHRERRSPALGGRLRRSPALVVGRGRVYTSGVGRGGVSLLAVRRGEAWPRTSGEADLALSPRVRRSWPTGVGRGGTKLPSSGKKRSSALVRPGVFNVRWLLVPPPWVPRY